MAKTRGDIPAPVIDNGDTGIKIVPNVRLDLRMIEVEELKALLRKSDSLPE